MIVEDTLSRRLLLMTVFITGTAVLIFEVGAIRLLAPYYGSSLTVVSSVLSTILLALSLGYYWGGRLADRYPSPLLLACIIGSAGVIMLTLLYLALTSLPSVAPSLGLGTGPLIISALCFFLPACLLGIDSPFVSKLLAQHTDNEGAVVGTVFFWSTIGSIVGSLLSGFYLIPTIGLTATFIAVAVVLVGWACFLFLVFGKMNKSYRVIGAGFIILTATFGTLAHSAPLTTRGNLLYAKDGQYSQLVVYEEDFNGTSYRFLKNDTNFSSAIIPNSYEIAFPYAELATKYEVMVPDARNYLVLGGGAFTIPRHVHHHNPDLVIDTVEIEPYLYDIARTYFDLPENKNLRTHTMDARVFLQSTTTTYDVVFSDVMNSGHFIPPHLVTKEFYESLKARMNNNGVAFINYIGSLDTRGTTMTGSAIKTLASVFPNYQLVPIHSDTDKKIQNIMVIIRNGDAPITFGDGMIDNRLYRMNYRIDDKFLRLKDNELTDEIIFTDEVPGMEPLLSKQFRLHGHQ